MSVKNVESLLERSVTIGSGRTQTQGIITDGYNDPRGIHPIPGGEGEPVTNNGGKQIDLYGADVPDDTIQGTNNEYGKVQAFNTPGGHTVEYNDTPGNERIMLRHKSGTGINIGPDGSIIISGKRRIDRANEDYFLEVKNGTMTFEGNLTLDVSGNLDINVGGEFNVNSSKKTEVVRGPVETSISGDDIKTVDGNQTSIVTGAGANQYLEGLTTVVKGINNLFVEGDDVKGVSGVLTMTAEQEIVLTSAEANIAADNLSLFGDTGTIGGENIIAYVKNIYGVSGDFSARFKAPVFEGDLTGTANQSITADVANSQNYSDPDAGGGTGSASGYTIDTTAIDTTATAKPTATLLTDYRTKSTKGTKKVKVDPNDVMKNNINLSVKTAGVSNKEISPEEVRRKLRDPAHRNNSEFISLMISQGKLSPEYANSTPPNISTVENISSTVIQGQTPLGSPSPALTAKRIKV